MQNGEIAEDIEELIKPVSVLYVSSYIPRKCGLATYTKDLTNALNLLNPLRVSEIAAMDNEISEGLSYPHEVKFRLKENDGFDYKELAYRINTDNNYDLISLQHEFGIFGENSGEAVLEFMDSIKKPIVTTLHTVLEEPTPDKEKILKLVAKKSKFLIVMLSQAKNILAERYGIKRDKIMVIHHGVPDFPRLDSMYWKRKMNLSRYTVMSSINLISPAKGIEYAVEAVPEIAKEIPNFLYLVIGETHPVYLKANRGVDVYRNQLKKRVKELGIEKHVRFVKEYLSLKKMIKYIGASDFYITPYLDPQQAASGALAYAIGAGKVCISSPYLYAEEMLGKYRGVIVPFRDNKEISESVVRIFNNPKEQELYQNNAYEVGRTMTWYNIAHQYLHLFKYAVNGSH